MSSVPFPMLEKFFFLFFFFVVEYAGDALSVSVNLSCCEIYQNQAYDLLNPASNRPLHVREDMKTGPFLHDITEVPPNWKELHFILPPFEPKYGQFMAESAI